VYFALDKFRTAGRRALILWLLCVLSGGAAGGSAQRRGGSSNRAEQLERAASLIASERLAEAEQGLNQILKVTPEEATALNLLGAIRAKQGKLDEAETLFARAVRSDAKLASAHMNLAYLYLLRREPEKSVSSLKEVLRIDPLNADAAYRLAWLLHSRGRFDECIALGEKLKATGALSAPLLGVLGDAYLKRGNRGGAVSALKRAIELSPAEPSYHFALAAAWLGHPPDLQEAEESFRKFLALRPEDAQGQLHLGYVLLKQKKHAEAREWLERSTRAGAGGGTPEAFYYLGLIAQAQNEDARAIELFEKSISLAPAFGHVHVALGSAYLKLKDYARAQAALETGAKLNPEDSKAHYNLALLYARLKQTERARAEMLIVERLKSEGKARDDGENEALVAPPPPR
jgi:tetratricopeptide (TPR) repeat protein